MSRESILDSLISYAPLPAMVPPMRDEPDMAARLDLFQRNLELARGKVRRCKESALIAEINQVLDEFKVRRLCYGLEAAVRPWVADLPPTVEGVCFSGAIEGFRGELFADIDAGLTGCDAALAETGTLVLGSSVKRPRLLSLVPPLHIAVVRAEQVVHSMADWLAAVDPAHMPSNFILISGPSKSADIEQVLAYGVHGPRALVVLLVEPE
jgi:L-lactate dehydrogenase complex protein LldG